MGESLYNIVAYLRPDSGNANRPFETETNMERKMRQQALWSDVAKEPVTK